MEERIVRRGGGGSGKSGEKGRELGMMGHGERDRMGHKGRGYGLGRDSRGWGDK